MTRWGRALVGLLVAAGLVGAAVAAVGAQGRARTTAPQTAPPIALPLPAPLDPPEVSALREEALRARDELRERRRAFAAASISSSATGPSIAVVEEARKDEGDPLATVDLAEVAAQRAVERGRHLIEAVAGCAVCHGADGGGQVLEDAWPWARVVAPDLLGATTGCGSTSPEDPRCAEDADPQAFARALRHGLRRDGTPTLAPCGGARALSDREIGDLWMYLRSVSRPAEAAPASLPRSAAGPGAWLAIGLGTATLPADEVAPASARPPDPDQQLAFGRHLFDVGCAWCHGGPTGLLRTGVGGPLAPLDGWTEGDFSSFLASGKRPDGTRVAGMPIGVSRELTTDERRAIFAALQTR